ncbi:YdeI/OmpD-associated family protein [Nonomuraea phyllanthi]|nr:YdeI/OmpD-associated family protein [Nonomuraea phyllanthi]
MIRTDLRLPACALTVHDLAVESARKPETRVRRIEKALAALRDGERP